MDIEAAKRKLRRKVPAFAKKLAPVYALLGWQWSGCGVPDEKRIAETLRGLIDLIRYDSEGHCVKHVSTGGLEVQLDDDGDYDEFTMRFKIEEYVLEGEVR